MLDTTHLTAGLGVAIARIGTFAHDSRTRRSHGTVGTRPDRPTPGTRPLTARVHPLLHLRHPGSRAGRRRRGLRVPHVAGQLPHRALRPLRRRLPRPATGARRAHHDLPGPLPRVHVHRGPLRVRVPGAPPARGPPAPRRRRVAPAGRPDPRRRVRRRLPPRPARASSANRAGGSKASTSTRAPRTRPRRAASLVHRGSIEELDLEPDRYDFAILIQTIEHVGDPAAVLRGDPAGAAARAAGCSSSPTTPARSTSRSPSGATGAATTSPATGTCSTRVRCAGSPPTPASSVDELDTMVSPVNWVYSLRNALDDWARAAAGRGLALARVARSRSPRSPRSTGCTNAPGARALLRAVLRRADEPPS